MLHLAAQDAYTLRYGLLAWLFLSYVVMVKTYGYKEGKVHNIHLHRFKDNYDSIYTYIYSHTISYFIHYYIHITHHIIITIYN